MGCFFGCFRIRDDHRPLVSEPLPSSAREPVVSRNRLSSLLLAEEKDTLPHSSKEDPALQSLQHDSSERELKDEAKFLKACGTLLETPTEFRKRSEKFKDLLRYDGDSEPSKFHSWLPNTSVEKLILEEQLEHPPTPIKLCEGSLKGSDYMKRSPSSCISSGQNAGRNSFGSTQGGGARSIISQASSAITYSVTDEALPAQHCRNKSVHFEGDDDETSFLSRSSPEISTQNSKQPESAAYADSMGNVKNPRIRSQYAYSVPNPVQDISQPKVLEEEDSGTLELSGKTRKSLEQADNATTKSQVGMREASIEKEFEETSLSSWFKPVAKNRSVKDQHCDSISIGKTRVRRASGDRPIIGMVAAHWNEEEPSHISPKYWDGNGIPNSTNKYKEDQKVSWHATPFEERLEKALSSETSISHGKHTNQASPIDFGETEESDTALSQLRTSTHSKPVISF
ncbi:protein JASON isoform X2 [Diospyros lotus]|uniref:protein JASON isoform X2 n=1 Tax=Diospyros lotus TaxID=55363 RepID=UPI0022540B26|nr:protein JASON isoform X2 [Diospyros lotus]